MSDTLASFKKGLQVYSKHKDARHRVSSIKSGWTARIFRCGLGRRHDVGRSTSGYAFMMSGRMCKLEEQETILGSTVVNGSRVHGALRSDTEGSVA